MKVKQHEEMHAEHRGAASEIDSWIDDIYMWSAEHKQALAWLAQIAAAIHDRDVELQQHQSVIDKLERHIRQHEHEIALQEQKGESQHETNLALEHVDFMTRQSEVKKSHAEIGKHHREQMAELHRLKMFLVDGR